MVEIQLQLFGQVGWSLHNRLAPIRGPIRLGVILSLAEAQGATVSVDSLLSRLWSSAPASGANAVQRHVSALRGQLQELGVREPHLVIQGVPGGYRLGAATTDLEIIERLLNNGSAGLDGVRWWDEPLIGVPWEMAQPLRSYLTQRASQALVTWSDALPVDRGADAIARAEQMLAHTPGCRAAHEVRQIAARRLRDEGTDLLVRSGAESLREIAGLWVHGRGSEALDLLEPAPPGVPEDLARRLCRVLIWLDPQEPWSNHVMSLLIEEGISSPVQHERSVITLDARALEEHGDGQALARAEVADAPTEWDLVRALRVQLMLSLSSPHNSSHDQLVARLSLIEHPDAQVESRRFRFLSHLRLGELDDARSVLEEYSDAVLRLWPGTGDDFAPMAAAALQRSIDPSAIAAFGPALPQISGFAADRWVLPVAETARRLILNDPNEPLGDTDYHIALATQSRSAQQAMRLLRELNAGRPVEKQAHALAAGVPSAVREKQFMMLPIALCLVAEALSDRTLADAAAHAIRPWSGQMLGMWPVDAFFGPANAWLDRLDAI